MSMSELQVAKTALAQTIVDFNRKGWSPATSTNYSLREYGLGFFWVSKSGKDKAYFTENDFMEVDLLGVPSPAFSAIKPSAETLIHCAIYEMFPTATCIVHSHSQESVCLSSLVKNDISFEGYEVQKAFEGQSTHDATVTIPVLDNTQDMVEFSQRLIASKTSLLHHCFVIRKHGTYAWGNSVAEAKRHLEALEYLIACELKLRS
jgi:methylthioribulose-1-phosphate dehydratase